MSSYPPGQDGRMGTRVLCGSDRIRRHWYLGGHQAPGAHRRVRQGRQDDKTDHRGHLAMAMKSALAVYRMYKMPDEVVFGLLVDRGRVSLFFGWVADQAEAADAWTMSASRRQMPVQRPQASGRIAPSTGSIQSSCEDSADVHPIRRTGTD
ncbi:hypothetical protein C8Q74DRAFT_933830 [Fomes fomentarius]|nr:hypothetical protein C8Q74DRAFT_933830 [Fomes fomentarius]